MCYVCLFTQKNILKYFKNLHMLNVGFHHYLDLIFFMMMAYFFTWNFGVFLNYYVNF